MNATPWRRVDPNRSPCVDIIVSDLLKRVGFTCCTEWYNMAPFGARLQVYKPRRARREVDRLSVGNGAQDLPVWRGWRTIWYMTSWQDHRLPAVDAGLVLPGRYIGDDSVHPADRVRNQDALIDHARRLAARIAAVKYAGQVPLIVGGDCSLLIGAGLALRATPGAGPVHVDGHTDFRHPGNSDYCASVAANT